MRESELSVKLKGDTPMITVVKVQHCNGAIGQLDKYCVEDCPLEVKTNSSSGTLTIVSSRCQTVYAKGAWSRVEIEYGEEGGYGDSKDWNQHPPIRETSITAVADAKAMLKKTVKEADKDDVAFHDSILCSKCGVFSNKHTWGKFITVDGKSYCPDCIGAETKEAGALPDEDDDEDADMVAAKESRRGLGERLDAALDRVEELEEEARVADEDDGDENDESGNELTDEEKHAIGFVDKANAAYAEKNKRADEAGKVEKKKKRKDGSGTNMFKPITSGP